MKSKKIIELDHLSHSSLSAFDCPLRGYRMIIKKEVPDETSTALVLGSAFHNTMEAAFFLRCWNRRHLVAYFNKMFNDEVKKADKLNWVYRPGAAKLEIAQEEGRQMVRNMFDRHSDVLREPFISDGEPYVEKEFSIVLEGMKIIGFIDLVLPTDGGILIIDWKTGKHLPEDVVDDDKFIFSTYKDQLQLYALAMISCRHTVSEMNLVFPRLCETVPYFPEDEMFKRQCRRVSSVMTRVTKFNELINDKNEEEVVRETFKPLPCDRNCRWCPFKNDCAYRATA